jgi:hypothetical protein
VGRLTDQDNGSITLTRYVKKCAAETPKLAAEMRRLECGEQL